MSCHRHCLLALLLIIFALPQQVEAKERAPGMDRLPKMVDTLLEDGGHMTRLTELMTGYDTLADDMEVSCRALRKTARVIHRHAAHWADATSAPTGSEDFLLAARSLVEKVITQDATDTDAQLAQAHLLCAQGYDQAARGDARTCEATLTSAATAFAKLADADGNDAHDKAQHYLAAASVLRAGAKFADGEIEMLKAASNYLGQAADVDPKNENVRAEQGMNMAACVSLHMKRNEKSDAKKIIKSGLELLRPKDLDRAKGPVAGAYNALVNLALEHKLDRKAEFAMKAGSRGSFTYGVPAASGWKSSHSEMLPAGETLLEVATKLNGSTLRVAVAEYDWRRLYFESEIGGDNAKGILDVISQHLEYKVIEGKSRKTGKRALPRWVKKAGGVMIRGTDNDANPQVVWVWTFKTVESRMKTYAVVAVLTGEEAKNPPPQIEAVLQSLVEKPKK